MNKIKKAAVLAAATASLAMGGLAATAVPAAAGPNRADCHAWAHSTSPVTAGVSATCNGGPNSVQFRVVGLCTNWRTHSSRWVYGWWMNAGISTYGCTLGEIAQPNPFYQTR